MRLLSLMTLSLVLLTGCNSTPLTTAPTVGADKAQQAAPGQWLGGLALPPGSFIRADQSLIIGSGESWVGRAVLDVGRDADAAYRFFLDNLQAQGWSVVTAVRGRQSLLVMTRQERTLTIEIAEPVLGSPTVYMTMAPRNATVMTPRKP
jgi:uncharacterized protein YcfL